MGYRKYSIRFDVNDYLDNGYSKEIKTFAGSFKIDSLLIDSDEDLQIAKEILENAMKTIKQRIEEKNENKNLDDTEVLDDIEEPDDMDCNDEEYEEGELCDYDAVGSFIADIEINVGKIESNDVNEDLVNTCYEKVYDILESDGVSIDSDEDELFERIKIKELEDGTTVVTIKDVECSVRVFIEAHNLDEANDERWSAFSNIVDPLNYLKNLRNDYVSEAD